MSRINAFLKSLITLALSSLCISSLTHSIAQNAAVSQPELRKELLEMVELDQKTMIDFKFNPDDKDRQARITQIYVQNTNRLRVIVAKFGWPGLKLVGADGSNGAFIIVQHSDQAPEFQGICLKKLAIAVKHGEAPRSHYAYLTDRVEINAGRKQVFGTQMEYASGEAKPKTVKDPDNLDKRRKWAGLEPISEYLEQVKSFNRTLNEKKQESVKP